MVSKASGVGVGKVGHQKMKGCKWSTSSHGIRTKPVVRVLICNRSEAERFTRTTNIKEALESLKFGGHVDTPVVTAGADGIYALENGDICHVPAFSDGRPVRDETGAGDASHCGIAHGLVNGLPLKTALRLATRAGFESCTAIGPTTNLLDERASNEYLEQFSVPPVAYDGAHVSRWLVFGGICVDKHFLVEQISEDKFSIVSGPKKNSGGGAANFSIAQRLLSPSDDVLLFANTGDDEDGTMLRGLVKHKGVKMPLDSLSKAKTAYSLIFTRSGVSKIHSSTGARESEIPLDLVKEYMPGAKACCIVSHALNEQLPVMISLAAEAEVPVFLGLGTCQLRLRYQAFRDLLDSVPRPSVAVPVA